MRSSDPSTVSGAPRRAARTQRCSAMSARWPSPTTVKGRTTVILAPRAWAWAQTASASTLLRAYPPRGATTSSS